MRLCYFLQFEFTESEKEKFKHKVNREDLEDRQENLILWTKSAKKNFSHKVGILCVLAS